MDNNITWHNHSVSLKQKIEKNGHKPLLLWYTGLSGSGKSSIANSVDKILHDIGCNSYILDGDNIRHGLNKDLGFGDGDRSENIRRICEVSKLFIDAGFIINSAFISPFVKDRDFARSIIGSNFVEIYIDTTIEICEQRDPKGLYKKARDGVIKDFTGITSLYEKPINPEIHIKTGDMTVEESSDLVLSYLKNNQIIFKDYKNLKS